MTNDLLAWATAIIGAYLLGSIPTGYLLVKKLTGEDIRDFGSGNIGATNVKRVAGTKAFIVVLLLDFFKGFIPVLAARQFLPQDGYSPMFGYEISNAVLPVLLSAASILGHSKSIFFGFKGGKSAATGLGGVVALGPVPGLLIALLAFAIIKLTRIVSLGSMICAVACPFMLYLFKAPLPYVVYGAVAGLYVIALHKANIGRLMSGTENRI